MVYRFGKFFLKSGFLLYAMLSTCNLTYGKGIVSVIMWPMFVSGVVLFCIRGIHIKQYIGTPHLWILICLCGSYVFSSIMNYEYFSKRTIVTLNFLDVLFWNFICIKRRAITSENSERIRIVWLHIYCLCINHGSN